MSTKLRYQRVLLKISGEALKGEREFGYDSAAVEATVARIAEARELGVQIALVVGAGNIWRGGSAVGMDRVTADHMGMLGTVMNALRLKDAFQKANIPVNIHASADLRPFAPRFDRDAALDQLSRGEIVIYAGGTGCPFFTTDTTAALSLPGRFVVMLAMFVGRLGALTVVLLIAGDDAPETIRYPKEDILVG